MMENHKNKLKNMPSRPSFGVSDISAKREIWKELAEELNGEFHIKQTISHDIEIHNISIPYKKWKIEISVSDVKPLKFQVHFTSRQLFELEMSWEDLIEKIRKKFGAADVQLGSKEFDRHYLIKSDQSHLVKKLITSEIQNTFLKYNLYSLKYHTVIDSTSSELTAIIQKKPGTKEMILEMITAFQMFIENLEKAKVIN